MKRETAIEFWRRVLDLPYASEEAVLAKARATMAEFDRRMQLVSPARRVV